MEDHRKDRLMSCCLVILVREWRMLDPFIADEALESIRVNLATEGRIA